MLFDQNYKDYNNEPPISIGKYKCRRSCDLSINEKVSIVYDILINY